MFSSITVAHSLPVLSASSILKYSLWDFLYHLNIFVQCRSKNSFFLSTILCLTRVQNLTLISFTLRTNIQRVLYNYSSYSNVQSYRKIFLVSSILDSTTQKKAREFKQTSDPIVCTEVKSMKAEIHREN